VFFFFCNRWRRFSIYFSVYKTERRNIIYVLLR